jgi:hypothetical protein
MKIMHICHHFQIEMKNSTEDLTIRHCNNYTFRTIAHLARMHSAAALLVGTDDIAHGCRLLDVHWPICRCSMRTTIELVTPILYLVNRF